MPKSRTAKPAKPAIELIRDPGRIAEIAEHLAKQPIIAFDTEFLRERTFYPQLGLLQLADKKDSWLIDPLEPSTKDLQPILDLLTNPDVLKVAHSAEQDQECLYSHYGIVAGAAVRYLDRRCAHGQGRSDRLGPAAAQDDGRQPTQGSHPHELAEPSATAGDVRVRRGRRSATWWTSERSSWRT